MKSAPSISKGNHRLPAEIPHIAAPRASLLARQLIVSPIFAMMVEIMSYRLLPMDRSRIRRLVVTLVLVCPLLLGGLATPPVSAQTKRLPSESERIIPEALLEELLREFDAESVGGANGTIRSIDRGRSISRFEKRHRSELQKFSPALVNTTKSTVRIDADRNQIALGTVVAADGLLVTKGSEVEGRDELLCHFSNGKNYPGKIVATLAEHDLALIRVDADDLIPVEWSDEPLSIGSLVVTGDETGEPLASGVISVERRVLIERGQAWLGVSPQPAPQGVRVQSVEPRSSADNIGLRIGDVILEIGGEKVKDVNGLANTIRRHEPGERVTIVYRRGEEERAVQATLQGRNVPGAFSRGNAEAGRFGSEPSRRASNFPEVLQHDSHLWPEQCGGPLTDLSGKAIAINIARGGRVESYAIPQDVVREVIEQLLAAARKDD